MAMHIHILVSNTYAKYVFFILFLKKLMTRAKSPGNLHTSFESYNNIIKKEKILQFYFTNDDR